MSRSAFKCQINHSSEIQNELISIAASKIREDICHEATDVSIIAIMVDDSKDISRKEQKSICIRHTHFPSLTVHVHEDDAQLQLKHMTDVDAKSHSEAILSSLTALGLNRLRIIVVQYYDGAATSYM